MEIHRTSSQRTQFLPNQAPVSDIQNTAQLKRILSNHIPVGHDRMMGKRTSPLEPTMKTLLIVTAVLATGLISFEASAAQPGPTYSSNGQGTSAGIVRRCGKNNPAMWGWAGNSCPKQKRAWNKGQH
jgi:hypothetical protein